MVKRGILVFAAMLVLAVVFLPAGMQISYADDGQESVYTVSSDGDNVHLTLCSYDCTNEKSGQGGKFSGIQDADDPSYGCSNYTVNLGDQFTITAYPDSGYAFKGWYEGEYIGEDDQGNPTQDARPYLDRQPLSEELAYTFTIEGDAVVCPVFEVASEPVDISGATVSGLTDQKYTGNAIEPSFDVTLDVNGTSITLVKGTDYTVAYSNNVRVGTATVTITGIGNYAGTITKEFKITSATNLSVKSLWASKHSVGKVLFKWSKKDGVSVDGWNVKYRMRKIGGSATWSGWTTKSFAANKMDTEISIKPDWVIEIHAQGKGDTTWSTGIITTPAGGKYQAMKYVHVLNATTGKRLDEKAISGSEIKQTTISLYVGQTLKVKPDYEYPVKNYTARPKLYPTQMLYDISDKSIVSITKPDGLIYSSGMIDGIATIRGEKAGTTTLSFRAPNGRTMTAKITVKQPKTYTFDGSTTGVDQNGNTVMLKNVLATNDKKMIILKGTIQFSERYRVGSNTIIDASTGQTDTGSGATIYAASNVDGCLMNDISSGNYDSAKNIVIKGGTWKRVSGYHNKTMMLFTHVSDLTIEDINEECAYDGGHCIELVACQNVVVRNCNLQMKGTNPANNEDEPLQIDHANRLTSPTIPTAYQNNHACKNVQVVGCTLQGGRGLCSGHCGSDTTNGAQNVYHRNIGVRNCTITGKSAEALALYNVVGCEVSGNTIKSQNSNISNFRSDGMCVRIPEGSKAPADMAKSTLTIKNNTVYGGRCGIIVNSLSASNFGKVVITGNKVYYKGDAKKAITVSRWYNGKSTAGCTSKVISGNTTKKGW